MGTANYVRRLLRLALLEAAGAGETPAAERLREHVDGLHLDSPHIPEIKMAIEHLAKAVPVDGGVPAREALTAFYHELRG